MTKNFEEFEAILYSDESQATRQEIVDRHLHDLGEPQEDGTTKLDSGNAITAMMSAAVDICRFELQSYHVWLTSDD